MNQILRTLVPEPMHFQMTSMRETLSGKRKLLSHDVPDIGCVTDNRSRPRGCNFSFSIIIVMIITLHSSTGIKIADDSLRMLVRFQSWLM